MLVITRRLNESILVGDSIRIVVLGVDGDRVRIGIEAPASLKILRAELIAEVRDTNREAIVTDIASLKRLLHPAHEADSLEPATLAREPGAQAREPER